MQLVLTRAVDRKLMSTFETNLVLTKSVRFVPPRRSESSFGQLPRRDFFFFQLLSPKYSVAAAGVPPFGDEIVSKNEVV